MTYLSSKSDADAAALIGTVGSPELRAELRRHLQSLKQGSSEATAPTEDTTIIHDRNPSKLQWADAAADAADAAAAAIPDTDEFIEEVFDGGDEQQEPQPPLPPSRIPQPNWRETPLLTRLETKALLPAVTPEARRWLHEIEGKSRGTVQQQRQLKELGRFAVKSERARAEAVAEKSRLQQVAEAQSHALLGAARQMQAMRSTYEQQKQELAREAQKSRQLERGLRALTRNQCNV